jgi:uncharacterized protein YndB with AHSA1/START domain
MPTNLTEASAREIVISRVVHAPRELVWEAWTNPKHVAQWWGPHGFTTTIEEMDVRPGGVWKHVMHGPDGTDYPNQSVFTEVVKPERIVFSHGGGKKGEPGVSFISTWTFEALGAQTRVTIRMVFPTAEARDHVVKEYGAIEGGQQTLGRLAEHLPKMAEGPHSKLVVTVLSDREIMLTRYVAAPRRLVFEAWTKPEHVARWWGPRSCAMSVCEMDFRPGGAWRFVLRGADGAEHPFKGVYHEITPPERLVVAECYDVAKAGRPSWLTTLALDEHDGKTKMTITCVFPSKEARDAHLNAGMERGAGESYDRLEEHLRTMGAK